MNRIIYSVLAIIVLSYFSSPLHSEAQAAIIRVPADRLTIQAGIDASSNGDTVLVSDGIYTGPGNVNLDFGGKAITVRSENGAANCIIDCEGNGRGFFFHSGEGETSVLSGFTITNGTVLGDELSDNSGGGIYCGGSSPTIASNVITNNFASNSGGGIFCIESSATIINNTITNNRAIGTGGGGICCWQASPIIDQNIITSNSVIHNGGGILCFDNSSPSITNNTISHNSANWGGGIRCYWGGGSPVIINNKIFGNSAIAGGGIACGWLGDNVAIGPSLVIANNIIYNNSAPREGGGIGCENSSPTIINNTIINNSGGISLRVNASPKILNVIVWRNPPREIDTDGTSIVNITYSNIQGGLEGEGNINAYPWFVDATNGNYRLRDYSPCIGSGILTPSMPSTDIEDSPRPNPPGSNPDLGAYENSRSEPLPLLPISVTIQSSLDSLLADGESTSTITITLKDDEGNFWSGLPIQVKVARGKLSDINDNGDGTYTAIYTASTDSGAETIDVSVLKFSGTKDITTRK